MQASWAIVPPLLLLISARKAEELAEEPPPRIQPRIFNGREISNGALGGMGIQIFNRTHLLCTGTLLTPRHFLTAAHCFDGMKLSDFHVIGGMTKEFNGHQTNFKRNRLVAVRISPDFERDSFIGDVAVAKIQYPLRSKYIGYAAVCKSPLFTSDTVTVAGWGYNGGNRDGSRNTLRYMKVRIVERSVCERQLGRSLPPNIICAGGYDGRTLCYGDSGGPLLFRHQVCGISTWTFKCGNSDKPDIYMSVRYYAKFIIKAVGEMGK
ncbi:seminase [Drosophila biarmipes]|uniref:seminase n=1 Tax=Drosophila biarmipes TaxID=125945 RepID=UPI0007E7572D|nr:seminase [Drosophila biarmipes]